MAVRVSLVAALLCTLQHHVLPNTRPHTHLTSRPNRGNLQIDALLPLYRPLVGVTTLFLGVVDCAVLVVFERSTSSIHSSRESSSTSSLLVRQPVQLHELTRPVFYLSEEQSHTYILHSENHAYIGQAWMVKVLWRCHSNEGVGVATYYVVSIIDRNHEHDYDYDPECDRLVSGAIQAFKEYSRV